MLICNCMVLLLHILELCQNNEHSFMRLNLGKNKIYKYEN